MYILYSMNVILNSVCSMNVVSASDTNGPLAKRLMHMAYLSGNRTHDLGVAIMGSILRESKS